MLINHGVTYMYNDNEEIIEKLKFRQQHTRNASARTPSVSANRTKICQARYK